MLDQIKSLRILHVAFVMSQLIFASVVFYLIKGSQMQPVLTELGDNEKIKTILFKRAQTLRNFTNNLVTP